MTESPGPETVVRSSRSRRTVESWALVLAATRIPHRLMPDADGWSVVVAEEQVARALEQLDRYERENESRPPPPAAPHYGPTVAGFALALALALAFVATGPFDPALPWHAQGAAKARAIQQGELWRTATALTLHVDLAHVAANVGAAAVFVTLVLRALGPGVGGAAILASGIAGNWLNAWAQGGGHVSVGASTGVFAAIGILCGMQFARRWRAQLARRQAWLPLAAGLALLAMLGTAGRQTDVSAHLLGLLSGVVVGAAIAFALSRPPGAAVQVALSVGALAVVGMAWTAALLAG